MIPARLYYICEMMIVTLLEMALSVLFSMILLGLAVVVFALLALFLTLISFGHLGILDSFGTLFQNIQEMPFFSKIVILLIISWFLSIVLSTGYPPKYNEFYDGIWTPFARRILMDKTASHYAKDLDAAQDNIRKLRLELSDKRKLPL